MAKRQTSQLPLDISAMIEAEAAKIQSQIAAPSGDRIRISKNGTIVCPDGSEGQSIECVILDFVSSNMYYDRPYTKDEVYPPACFSIGKEPSLLCPSKNSPNRVSDTCSACPNNQFGSALSGKGKACKNTRLVAVSPIEGEDNPIWILSVPPTSVKTFDAYVSNLATRNKTIPVGVVTRISQDSDSEFVKPNFDVVRPLDAEELGVFFPLREAALTRLMSEPDTSGYEAPKPRGRR